MRISIRQFVTTIAAALLAFAMPVHTLAATSGETAASAKSKAVLNNQGYTSYVKAADGGRVAKLEGAFTVTYQDYVVAGSQGEYFIPPSSVPTAKTRVVITRDASISSSGADAFTLTAQGLIDMILEDETILATGGVHITSRDTVITAEKLQSGQITQLRPVIDKSVAELKPEYIAMLDEWLGKAETEDRLMLIEGDVKASDPDFRFSGQKLIVNSTKENYLFLGPHVVEINVDDAEE